MALEIVSQSFIEKKYEQLKLNKSELDSLFIRAGLNNIIMYIIPSLVSEEIRDEYIKLILICKGAINKRNKIAHKGLSDLNPKSVSEDIKSIEKIINIIDNEINQCK